MLQAAEPAEVVQVVADRDALRTENEALRNELAAFDEKFFEEIFDLKFRHSEALKEIKQLKSENEALRTAVRSKERDDKTRGLSAAGAPGAAQPR